MIQWANIHDIFLEWQVPVNMAAHSLKSVTIMKCLEAKSLLKMSHPVSFCEVDAQPAFDSADQQFH